jgi:hypothetical protein
MANFRGRQLLPRLFPKLSFPEYAWMGGLPTIRSYVNKATDGRHKRNKTGKRWETIQHCVLWEFGTNSVQLRERKSGSLASMRHQMKHLDFLSFLLESKRSIRALGNALSRSERAATVLIAGLQPSELFGATFPIPDGSCCGLIQSDSAVRVRLPYLFRRPTKTAGTVQAVLQRISGMTGAFLSGNDASP